MSAPHWVAIVVAALACVTDVRARRIPNWLTFVGAAAGVVANGASHGLAGVGSAVGGWVIGLVLFLPLFLLRGMGGGDVKLLAAIGACLGAGLTVWLALYSAIAGGVLALGIALAHGYSRQAFRNVWGLLSYWRVMGVRPHPALTLESSQAPRLPYSLPIAAGLGITLWLR